MIRKTLCMKFAKASLAAAVALGAAITAFADTIQVGEVDPNAWQSAYRYFRFKVDAIRRDNDYMQISDVGLFDENGARFILGTDFTLTCGDNDTSGNEGEAMAVDTHSDGTGNYDTKWGTSDLGNAWIQFNLTSPKSLSKYNWSTANDTAGGNAGRQPKSWRLLASNDGSTWSFVDFQENNTSIPCINYQLAYEKSFAVAPSRNIIEVNNMEVLSPAMTTDNVITGAGGLNINRLSIPANATVLFDPVKTPVFVYGATAGDFTIGSNVKFKLTSNYADMNLGRIVLLTCKDDTVTLPATLNDLFDRTSIASGATYSVTVENAPESGCKQLVLTVGDYANDAKEIRITCIGDSITQGVSHRIANRPYYDYAAQYRTCIAARLAANGYKPKMLGIWKHAGKNAANALQPDDWVWHSGISGDRIKTGGTNGGVRDNLHVYLDVAGNVDALTLLIGTNDLGVGDTAEDTYVAYTNLVFDIARQRPATKIIGSTILDRDGATSGNHAKIVSFNSLLAADYAANRLPANYVMLDLFAGVPLTSGEDGNFFDDLLHPSWAGCSAIAECFAAGIANALPLATYSGPIEDEATDAAQSALGVAGIAATTEGAGLAAYTNGMVNVFTIEKTTPNNVLAGSSPYTATNTATALNRPVTKAGYFMELVRRGTSRHRWVWVDFDATGKTLDEIDFPWTGDNVDLVVDNLHVFSNDSSIHNVAANVSGVKGAIEGTCWNYEGADDNAIVPDDIAAGNFGWDDTLLSVGGYGCFQAHRIFNEGEHWHGGEVLFAWNAWGSEVASEKDGLGIGTFFYSQPLGGDSGNSADYTFTGRATDGAADTISASGYQVVHLEIWAALDGEPRPGVWSGMGGNNDFDTAANWEDGVVPSAGDDIDFGGVPADATIAVTGASANTAFGTATMGSSVVTFTGNVAFTNITDNSKIAVGANSTVTFNGDLEFSGHAYDTTDNYVVYSVAEGGKFVVTGDIVATAGFTGANYVYPCKYGLGGAVQARGLVNNATGNGDEYAFRIVPESSGTVKWIIGDHGISGSKYFWAEHQTADIQPLGSDFTVSTRVSDVTALTFNTTGADGNPHEITVGNGGMIAWWGGRFDITGSGRFVVDAENPFPGAVNVSETATLAINAGKRMTTGAISVASNATLQVAESGTVALGGDLTLADGAILGFNFTDRSIAPVLDLADKTVTFGEQKQLKVLLSGARPAFGSDGKYVLTSGGKFTGAGVAKSDDCPYWVNAVGVDGEGNIYAEVIPLGAIFIVK